MAGGHRTYTIRRSPARRNRAEDELTNSRTLPTFAERLRNASESQHSLLCVGLDPDRRRMPSDLDVLDFNRAIVDATSDLVCAYKTNLAFYLALGSEGIRALERTMEHIRATAPEVVLIYDCKAGDIPSSTEQYAKAVFETFGFDCATVNAYGGRDTLEPFLRYEGKGVFVWCRSSNRDAKDFQDLPVSVGVDRAPLYQVIAREVSEWGSGENVGLVVGATYPDDVRDVRDLCPDMPLLVPGVGAQRGDLESTVRYGVDANSGNLVINASRSILYASSEKEAFADAARAEARNLLDFINHTLESTLPEELKTRIGPAS